MPIDQCTFRYDNFLHQAQVWWARKRVVQCHRADAVAAEYTYRQCNEGNDLETTFLSDLAGIYAPEFID